MAPTHWTQMSKEIPHEVLHNGGGVARRHAARAGGAGSGLLPKDDLLHTRRRMSRLRGTRQELLMRSKAQLQASLDRMDQHDRQIENSQSAGQVHRDQGNPFVQMGRRQAAAGRRRKRRSTAATADRPTAAIAAVWHRGRSRGHEIAAAAAGNHAGPGPRGRVPT